MVCTDKNYRPHINLIAIMAYYTMWNIVSRNTGANVIYLTIKIILK